MRLWLGSLAALFLCMAGGFAHAQGAFPTPAGGGAGVVNGHVDMCLNASNQAIPFGPSCASGIPVQPVSGGSPYTYTKPATPGDQFGLSVVTATGLTVPAGAKYAMITVEGNSVRWRDDGTAPTASVGTLVQVGTSFTYSGPLSAIQFIQTAATATLDVNYYK